MLTSIIVYLYTVLAFNFFRKFYVQEEEGEESVSKCHDMLSVRRATVIYLFIYYARMQPYKKHKIQMLYGYTTKQFSKVIWQRAASPSGRPSRWRSILPPRALSRHIRQWRQGNSAKCSHNGVPQQCLLPLGICIPI